MHGTLSSSPCFCWHFVPWKSMPRYSAPEISRGMFKMKTDWPQAAGGLVNPWKWTVFEAKNHQIWPNYDNSYTWIKEIFFGGGSRIPKNHHLGWPLGGERSLSSLQHPPPWLGFLKICQLTLTSLSFELKSHRAPDCSTLWKANLEHAFTSNYASHTTKKSHPRYPSFM